MDREGSIRLLSAILANQPRLRGAACRGRYDVFDEVRGNGARYKRQEQIRRVTAARVCAGCPVIHQCPSVTTTTTDAA